MKRVFSNVAVAIVAAYALAVVVSVASAFWSVPGTFGFTADYNATVRAVTADGPAARAGVAAGDRVALAAMPFEQRRFAAGVGAPVPPDAVLDLVVDGPRGIRNVHLTAVPAPLKAADRWTLLLVTAASALFIVVGLLLIVIRPSPATWGFGLFCLLTLPAEATPLAISDPGVALAVTFAYDIIQNLGVVGLVLFTLEFPHPVATASRLCIRRSLPLLFVVLSLMTLYPDVANLILGRRAGYENVILQVLFGGVFVLAMGILADTFRHVDADERERVRWVLVGFSIGLLMNYVGQTLFFSTLIVANPPVWLVNTLISLNVLLPLTVAHAVVRHRVLDINFVVGRALIFAVMTTLLAAVFGLVDWFFGTVLEDFRLSRVLAATIAISFAFVFGRVERATERAIEAIFFRKRHLAEEHMERITLALPHARSMAVVEHTLVHDASTTFDLASAAVYRMNAGGTAFARTAAQGWADADCPSLDDTDPLLLMLRSEKKLVDVDDVPWSRADVPGDGHEPHIAIPIMSYADLAGFVLYGDHRDGASLDPEERERLEALVAAAGLAFDQLDAQQLRDENERQNSTIAELRARLDELRRA